MCALGMFWLCLSMSIVDPIGLARVVGVGKPPLRTSTHQCSVLWTPPTPGQGQGKTGSGVGNAQLSAVGIACSVGGRDTLMLGLGTATYSYTPCNTASFPVDFLQSTFPAQCVLEQGELANAKVLFIAHVHTQARGHTSTPHPHPHQTSDYK